MYVDKDRNELISILEIAPAEAEILIDAICVYFSEAELKTKSPEEKAIIQLKKELENEIGI